MAYEFPIVVKSSVDANCYTLFTFTYLPSTSIFIHFIDFFRKEPLQASGTDFFYFISQMFFLTVVCKMSLLPVVWYHMACEFPIPIAVRLRKFRAPTLTTGQTSPFFVHLWTPMGRGDGLFTPTLQRQYPVCNNALYKL